MMNQKSQVEEQKLMVGGLLEVINQMKIISDD